MEEHLFEKWLTPWKAQTVVGGWKYFSYEIKIKLPGRAKFRNHDYQISFLKNYSIIWCYYFWRVLLVITNPSFWLFHFVPQYTLISPPHLFQENWHDHKKIWKFHQFPLPIVQGGAGVMTWELCLKCERAPRSVFETHI